MNIDQRRGRLLVVAGCLLGLAACSTIETKDPDFAAARPRAVPPPAPSSGAIYRPGYELVLFEDLRARRVGDILTIRLAESTDATKKAATTIQKSNDSSISNPTILGTTPQFDVPGFLPLASTKKRTLETKLGSSHDFSGDAESKQSNKLTGDISVTVAEVLPNGNLFVRGEKMLSLNQGKEHIRLSGIVRPEDIADDNTIASTKVADARIIYAGEGAVAESNVIGWLSRFFISALFPF